MRPIWARPQRPPLLPALIEELEHYGLEELRSVRNNTVGTGIRLPNAFIKRDELEAWIAWKANHDVWRKSRRFWAAMIVAFVGAVAGTIAVLRG